MARTQAILLTLLGAAALQAQTVDIGGFCKGALIGPRTVLTAWHCLEKLAPGSVTKLKRGSKEAVFVGGSRREIRGCTDVGVAPVVGSLGEPEQLGYGGSRKTPPLPYESVFGKQGRMKQGQSGSPLRSGEYVIGVALGWGAAGPGMPIVANLRPCMERLRAIAE